MREIKVEPDAEVIDGLEALLERAKDGEIQSIAYVVSFKGYHTANAWHGMNKCNLAMIGELESLKTDLMRYFVEQRVEYLEI